jgi:hypothetical protein
MGLPQPPKYDSTPRVTLGAAVPLTDPPQELPDPLRHRERSTPRTADGDLSAQAAADYGSTSSGKPKYSNASGVRKAMISSILAPRMVSTLTPCGTKRLFPESKM